MRERLSAAECRALGGPTPWGISFPRSPQGAGRLNPDSGHPGDARAATARASLRGAELPEFDLPEALATAHGGRSGSLSLACTPTSSPASTGVRRHSRRDPVEPDDQRAQRRPRFGRERRLGAGCSGQGDLHREPRPGAAFRFDFELPTDGCDSLVHPDESESVTGSLRSSETASIILDRENHGPFPAREADVHGFRLRVLDNVRQSLLCDPEDGGLELWQAVACRAEDRARALPSGRPASPNRRSGL